MDVGFCLTGDPIPFASSQENKTILRTWYNILTKSLNKNTGVLVFPYDKGFIVVFVLKEVEEFFIVNLEERAVDSKLRTILLGLPFQSLKYLLNGPRN